MKKFFAVVLMIITLGGCMMKQENRSANSSEIPSADWEGAKEAVTTNLSAIFKEKLEEKYGETFIIKSVSTPSLMQPYYSAKFAPEWKPDVKLTAQFYELGQNGQPLSFQDSYLGVKFNEQAKNILKPVFDPYFSEYEISVSYGRSFYPDYLDGNSTFEEFEESISDFGPGIVVRINQSNTNLDYINTHFEDIVGHLKDMYPQAGSFILVFFAIDDENNRTVLDRKSVSWGRN